MDVAVSVTWNHNAGLASVFLVLGAAAVATWLVIHLEGPDNPEPPRGFGALIRARIARVAAVTVLLTAAALVAIHTAV
jgi:hypothetical protein